MKHPRAYWTFRRRAIVSGLLSRYCRYHGLESVSSRIRRKTESRIEESETKSNFDNRLLAKIKINGFTNLLPRFIVRLRLIHMVQRLLKLSAHHTIWLTKRTFPWRQTLLWKSATETTAFNRRCTIWISPTLYGLLYSVRFRQHWARSRWSRSSSKVYVLSHWIVGRGCIACPDEKAVSVTTMKSSRPRNVN